MRGCFYSGRVFLSLLLLMSSCFTPCRQWVYEKTPATLSCHQSAQMTLCGSFTSSPLTIAIVHTVSGVRMYINLLQIEAPLNPNDPSRVPVHISIDAISYVVLAYRFDGGQRLLIPDEESQQLINFLLEGQSFYIAVGNYRSDVVADGFSTHYKAFMSCCQ